MFRLSKMWTDLLAGFGLLLALLIVIALEWALRSHPPAPSAGTGDLHVNVISSTAARQGPAKKLRLAVTPTERSISESTGQLEPWDDMGKLLNQLGEGYRFDVVLPAKIAKDAKVLDPYDVLFLTCAPGGLELRSALINFVNRGGTLYASDFRYDAVAAAFPEMVGRATRGDGVSQDVVADVVDPSLREVIGPTIPLRFDLSQWKVAAFAGPRVTPLLHGGYKREKFPNDRVGVPAQGSFLVRFPVGKGTVIFTSFHNEKQNSELETKLLQYLVFQLVNASVDSEVTQTNEKAGFEPSKSNLLSTPKDNPQVTKTYTHTKAGPLRFSLAFRNDGARLRLNLRSPDGKTYKWEGDQTLILEVPEAVVGEWQATVTALHLPYENFVFSVTFGAKK